MNIRPFLLFLATFALMGMASAQNYQIPNGDFEQWEGSGNSLEPTHWNSFYTSDGSYASLASSSHHYRRSGGRPGSVGSSYLTIYTKSILSVKANGNMTTGRIHAGAMQASSSQNYNYTQRSNSDFSMPFTATPDSIYMWVSYYAKSASSLTSVKAIIHGDSDFKDPNDNDTPSLYAGKAIAEFARTTSSASTPQWTLLKVPFDYSGSASPAYMLISLTTNKTPGGGDANDSLMIDDMVLVYSAWLTSISLGGNAIEGFSKGVFNYDIGMVDSLASFVASVGYQTEVADATVVPSVDYEGDTVAHVTLTVTAEDGVTQKVYTLTAHQEAGNGQGGGGEDPVGIDKAEAPHLTLAPNPADNFVKVGCVDYVGSLLLTVVDINGRTVRCATHHSDGLTPMVVDLRGLPQGAYILRLQGLESPYAASTTLVVR